MAFPTIGTVSAVGIKDIAFEIFDPDPLGSESQSIRGTVQIEMSDGSTKIWSDNLVPHLTAGQISDLQSFAAAMRTQAEDEFLP